MPLSNPTISDNPPAAPEITQTAAKKLASIGGDFLSLSKDDALGFVQELRHKRQSRRVLISAAKLKAPVEKLKVAKKPKAPRVAKKKGIENEENKEAPQSENAPSEQTSADGCGASEAPR